MRRPRITLEDLLSRVLRTGVGLSVAFLLTGVVVTFLHHPSYTTSSGDLGRLTRPGNAPSTLAEVARGVARGDGQALVMVGLLILLATPIARVVLALASFVLERDRAFVALTTVVLALLLVSLMLGRAGG